MTLSKIIPTLLAALWLCLPRASSAQLTDLRYLTVTPAARASGMGCRGVTLVDRLSFVSNPASLGMTVVGGEETVTAIPKGGLKAVEPLEDHDLGYYGATLVVGRFTADPSRSIGIGGAYWHTRKRFGNYRSEPLLDVEELSLTTNNLALSGALRGKCDIGVGFVVKQIEHTSAYYVDMWSGRQPTETSATGFDFGLVVRWPLVGPKPGVQLDSSQRWALTSTTATVLQFADASLVYDPDWEVEGESPKSVCVGQELCGTYFANDLPAASLRLVGEWEQIAPEGHETKVWHLGGELSLFGVAHVRYGLRDEEFAPSNQKSWGIGLTTAGLGALIDSGKERRSILSQLTVELNYAKFEDEGGSFLAGSSSLEIGISLSFWDAP